MHSVVLAEILKEARPGFASGNSDPSGIIQIRMNNVSVDGELNFAALRRVPGKKVDLNRFAVMQGDILFNATNSPELVGKTALFPGFPEPVVYSNHFLRLRTFPDKADSSYVARWLQFMRHQGTFTSMCRQWVNQAAVPTDRLLKMLVPLPYLSTQRRITAILDQADALRAKRRAALAQLDEMAEAVFKTMFLSAAGWPEITVGELARSIRTGPFGSQLLHSEFVAEGVAVLGIDNAVKNEFAWGERRFVTMGKYKELARYRVYPRDIIVTIMGTCGRAAIVPNDIPLAITTKHLCSITLDETRCLPEYLHACLLQHPAVLHQLGVTARGAIMPGLNMGLIKETKISLPPIGLQESFAKLQSQFGKLRDAFARSKDAADALFASLQHRAFRGEL